MTEETPAQKRATTRKITETINELKRYMDFKDITFIKEGNGYSGLIVMFDKPIDLNEVGVV